MQRSTLAQQLRRFELSDKKTVKESPFSSSDLNYFFIYSVVFVSVLGCLLYVCVCVLFFFCWEKQLSSFCLSCSSDRPGIEICRMDRPRSSKMFVRVCVELYCFVFCLLCMYNVLFWFKCSTIIQNSF